MQGEGQQGNQAPGPHGPAPRLGPPAGPQLPSACGRSCLSAVVIQFCISLDSYGHRMPVPALILVERLS